MRNGMRLWGISVELRAIRVEMQKMRRQNQCGDAENQSGKLVIAVEMTQNNSGNDKPRTLYKKD